jgi:hypothetical protein
VSALTPVGAVARLGLLRSPPDVPPHTPNRNAASSFRANSRHSRETGQRLQRAFAGFVLFPRLGKNMASLSSVESSEHRDSERQSASAGANSVSGERSRVWASTGIPFLRAVTAASLPHW